MITAANPMGAGIRRQYHLEREGLFVGDLPRLATPDGNLEHFYGFRLNAQVLKYRSVVKGDYQEEFLLKTAT